MKSSFIPLLLFASLPLVLASGPKKPWWNPFWKPQPVKDSLPDSSPVPEQLPVANEVSPMELMDDLWFYGRQKPPAASDYTPETCASGDEEGDCSPEEDKTDLAQTTITTPKRKKHVHRKHTYPKITGFRAAGVPNPLIDVDDVAEISADDADDADANRVDPNPQSNSVGSADTSNSSSDKIDEHPLQSGKSGWTTGGSRWSSKQKGKSVVNDSPFVSSVYEVGESSSKGGHSDNPDTDNPKKSDHDDPNPKSKSVASTPSKKTSTLRKIKNVSASIFNKLKDFIGKPWVRKDSADKHDNPDSESESMSSTNTSDSSNDEVSGSSGHSNLETSDHEDPNNQSESDESDVFYDALESDESDVFYDALDHFDDEIGDSSPKNSETSASDGEESSHDDPDAPRSPEISPVPADDASTKDDQITKSPTNLKDGKPKKPSKIQAAASYVKDACVFGVNCIKGIFGKGKKDEKKSDHNIDTIPISPNEPAVPTHPIPNTNAPPQTQPISVIAKPRKTWADKIMALPPHERFVLFRAGSSYNLNEPRANAPGLFYRVGQFCKCVLGTIAEVPVKFVEHLKGPVALESAETTI